MRGVHLVLAGITAVLGIPLVAIIGLLAWLDLTVPWAELPQDARPFSVAYQHDSFRLEGGERRLHRDMAIALPDGETVRFAVNLPLDPLPGELPVIILVSGLKSGKGSLYHVPEPGRNAVIGYEYPNVERLNGIQRLRLGDSFGAHLAVAHRSAHLVPGQLAVLAQWAVSQPWANAERVSLVGISLGTIFLPAAERALAASGIDVSARVFAYGGADLRELIEANMPSLPAALRAPVSQLVAFNLRRIDPRNHLPEVSGPALVVMGKDDPRIPARTAELLAELLEGPKTIVMLSGGHLSSQETELVAHVNAISRRWLYEIGATNPW